MLCLRGCPSCIQRLLCLALTEAHCPASKPRTPIIFAAGCLATMRSLPSISGWPCRTRPGPGPPPLLYFLAPRPPPLPQRPVRFAVGLRRPNDGAGGSNGLVTQGSGPFLYDPFSAKREQARLAGGPSACLPADCCSRPALFLLLGKAA